MSLTPSTDRENLDLTNSYASEFEDEFSHAENFLVQQDVDSASRFIMSVRAGVESREPLDLMDSIRLDLISLEVRALLGLEVVDGIAAIERRAIDIDDESFTARLVVVKIMAAILSRDKQSLLDIASKQEIPSSFESLTCVLLTHDNWQDRLELTINSPISSSLRLYSLLFELEFNEAIEPELFESRLREIEEALGEHLPSSSALPVTVWRLRNASASPMRWVKGRLAIDLSIGEFERHSYGWLYSRAMDAIKLAEDEEFVLADRIFESLKADSRLDPVLKLSIFSARLKSKIGMGSEVQAAALIDGILLPGPDQGAEYGWSDEEFWRIVSQFIENLAFTKINLDLLIRTTRKMILRFGEGSPLVQKMRISVAFFALEQGQFSTSIDFIRDFESAHGLRADVEELDQVFEYRVLLSYFATLDYWGATGLRIDDRAVVKEENEFIRISENIHHIAQNFDVGTAIYSGLLSDENSVEYSLLSGDGNRATLSGLRVDLLGLILEYREEPSDKVFDELCRLADKVPSHFIPGLISVFRLISGISASRGFPDYCSDLEKRIIDSVKDKSKDLQANVLICFSRDAESRYDFHRAAVLYERLLGNGCYWIDSSGELDSSVVYRAAHCWAMNFNFSRSILRAREALKNLESTAPRDELIVLLDLVSRCDEHLGNYFRGMESLRRACELISGSPNSDARAIALFHLRAGRCAEELGLFREARAFYMNGSHTLEKHVSSDDHDLIALKNREFSSGLSLGVDDQYLGTFYVNRRTFDSPS